MTHADLQNALALFSLTPPVTLSRIRERHRELAMEHHPDRNNGADAENMSRINAAYELLYRYCTDFRFAFTEEEFLDQNPEERLRRQFATDPLWGKQ
jgi:hypothetical protein